MDPRRPPHRPITKSRQLLVEGRTPLLFLEALARHLALNDVEVHDFGGKDQFEGFLRSFCARPEFHELVTSLGIIRDAEYLPNAGQPRRPGETAEAAFNSICHSLSLAGQAKPTTMGTFTDRPPKIGVFILPDCHDDGMLETLCLRSVLTPERDRCIDDFFQCMAVAGTPTPPNRTKAKTFAFLATQEITDPLVGRAAQKGIWPWGHAAFEKLTHFLRAL